MNQSIKTAKTVCIWAPTVECAAYTIARTVSLSGASGYVVTKPKEQVAYRGHSLYYDKIARLKNIQITNPLEPIALDWLYIHAQFNSSKAGLKNWVQAAKHIGIFSSCRTSSFPNLLRSQLKEIFQYFPASLRAERVICSDGFYPFDLYCLWAKRDLMGFDVHSSFLENDELFHKLFASDWAPETPRKYKLSFIGNANPGERTKILISIKEHLINQGLYKFDCPAQNSEVYWVEYGLVPGTSGIPAIDYLDILSHSDFSLCPPGYSRLTHRTIEALIRGCIPVLHDDELKLYDINLQDGVNCIAVKHRDWIRALETIQAMSLDEIAQLRFNILSMREQYLSDAAFSKRLGFKMGIVE